MSEICVKVIQLGGHEDIWSRYILGSNPVRVYGGVDEMNLGVRFTILVYCVYI